MKRPRIILLLLTMVLSILSGCNSNAQVDESQEIESQRPSESAQVETEAPTKEMESDTRGILGSHGTDIRMGLTQFGLEEAPISSAPEAARDVFAYTSTARYQDVLLGVSYDYSLTMDSEFQIIGASFGITNDGVSNTDFIRLAKLYLGFCATMPYDASDSSQVRNWVESNIEAVGNGESAFITVGDAKFELYGTASGDGFGSIWMDISKDNG